MYDYGSYYDYSTSYDTVATAATGLMAFMGFISVVSLVISVITIISMWKIFTQNGEKGWKSIIPIYNSLVLLKIVGLPGWYFLLNFVPIANIYALYKTCKGLADLYGKSTTFAILCMFFSFICYPILAFGGKKTASTVAATSYQTESPVGNTYATPVSVDPVLQPTEANVAVGAEENVVSTTVERPVSNILMSQQVNMGEQPTTIQPVVEQPINASETNVAITQPVQQSQTTSAIPNVVAQDRVCPNCGSKVGAEAKVCFMCGTRI